MLASIEKEYNNFKYNISPISHKTSSDSAVLVLHGYLGSCQTMIYINNALIKENFSVESPNLLGHGTVYSDLHNIKYEEWIEQIETIYFKLKKRYKKVFIIGFSTGGVLALYMAEKYKKINGIVTINSPLKYPISILLTSYFKSFVKYLPTIKSDIKDPKSVGSFLYKRVSVKNSYELLKLSKIVKKNISKCGIPILVFKSVNDHRVNFKNGKNIFNRVSSLKKELIYLKNSYHAAVLDYDKDLIIEKIINFIKEN